MKNLLKIIRGEAKVMDIYHYLLGNYRYFLYYNKYVLPKVLIRDHIWEQIEFRIKNMDKKCFMDGQCKICECKTTALQMCNKACNKPCYPEMMSKRKWNLFKVGKLIYQDDGGVWYIDINGNLHNTAIKNN